MTFRAQSWLVLGVIVASIASIAIATLKPESFNETRRLLRDDQQYMLPLSSARKLGDDPAVERILATRRSLKFITQLADLPLEKRIAVLDADMTALVDAYVAATETVLAHLADPSKPKNTTSFLGLKYNMLTVLFAAAHLTDEATLTSLLKKSEALTGRVTKLCVEPGVPELYPKVALIYVGPSRDDIVDFVMHCREKSGGFAQLESLAIPADVVSSVTLAPWNPMGDLFASDRPVRAAPASGSRAVELVKVHRFCVTASTTEEMERDSRILQQFDDALPDINVEAICPARSNSRQTK
jgi:hypothetical protein